MPGHRGLGKAPVERPRNRPWAFPLALAALTVLGAALRIGASDSAFVGDELFTYTITSHEGLDDALRGVQETENTPPLFYAMAWICDRLFADLKLIRLPALLAGTALIPVTALVAKRVYGTPAALLCAALAALSPFAIYYSSEARAYAPAALAVTCSTLALLRALDLGARGWWAAFAVSTAAAMWLHYTAVFPLAAQAAWALAASPDQRRNVLLWLIVALLLYAPWLPFAGSNVPIELIGVLQDFAAVQVLEYPLRSIVGYPYLDLSYVPGTWELVALGAALAVATAMLARGPHRFRSLDLLLVGLAAGAPLGLTAYTVLRTNILLPRNVFVSAPALMVLTAGLVARRQPRVAVPVAVAIVALLVWPAWRTGFGDLRRAPYDEVAEVLDSEAAADVPVIEVSPLPVDGPLREHLRAWFKRSHALVFADGDQRRAWRRGLQAGHVFVVFPQSSRFPELNALTRVGPPRDPRFRAVRRREWDDALLGLVMIEYVPRRPDP